MKICSKVFRTRTLTATFVKVSKLSTTVQLHIGDRQNSRSDHAVEVVTIASVNDIFFCKIKCFSKKRSGQIKKFVGRVLLLV